MARKSSIIILLIALAVLAVPASADTQTGGQSATIYGAGEIYKNTNNTVYSNGTVAYSPAPALADVLPAGILFNTTTTAYINVIQWSTSSSTFEWYSKTNSGATTICFNITGLTPSKAWVLERNGGIVYDGSIFTNASGGLAFQYMQGAGNFTMKLTMYGGSASSGSTGGSTGGASHPHTTTATTAATTTANGSTSAGSGAEDGGNGVPWIPPSLREGGGYAHMQLAACAIIVLLVIAFAQAIESSGGRKGAYVIGMGLASLVLLLTNTVQADYEPWWAILLCIVTFLLLIAGASLLLKRGGKRGVRAKRAKVSVAEKSADEM